MYESLPKIERSFEFSHVGPLSGKKYDGTFTIKCALNVGAKHSLELEKTRLMADYTNPSPGLLTIAVSLSTVRHMIIKAPDWWKDSKEGGELLEEDDVVMQLYDKCIEVQKKWREELKSAGKEAAQGNG